jgi:ABC-type bacteriocin/lantibiotic exporter with double-glycine peptidase domain
VLRNLNFEIPGGKFTAIVGQSGAGKTTIFLMLVRLMQPTEGRILINDVPLSDVPLSQLRRLIGFIPQNPFIFNQSLRDNLLMAVVDEQNAETALAQAVVTARLGEVVRSRAAEGGLDALAGHMGAKLSGGERQRIALGRLLIQDPQVVVCDEYTANIDVKSARIIDRTIHEYFSDRTRIVITHALYTITGADHIVVVDGGTVSQTGTHSELAAVPGLYRELWEVQAVGELTAVAE